VGRFQSDVLSRYAEELVRAAPDVLLAFATPALISLHPDRVRCGIEILLVRASSQAFLIPAAT